MSLSVLQKSHQGKVKAIAISIMPSTIPSFHELRLLRGTTRAFVYFHSMTFNIYHIYKNFGQRICYGATETTRWLRTCVDTCHQTPEIHHIRRFIEFAIGFYFSLIKPFPTSNWQYLLPNFPICFNKHRFKQTMQF